MIPVKLSEKRVRQSIKQNVSYFDQYNNLHKQSVETESLSLEPSQNTTQHDVSVKLPDLQKIRFKVARSHTINTDLEDVKENQTQTNFL